MYINTVYELYRNDKFPRKKKKKKLMSSVNSDNIENFAFNGNYTHVTIQI